MPRAEYIRLNAAAKLAHPLDAACCARVVEAVLKHALFMQQQLPCPYDQLFHEISMANARRRPSGGVRKAMRLVSAMQALLDQLPEALLRAGSAGKGKFNVIWEDGIWLGVIHESGETIVGAEQGIIKAKDFRRQ